MPGALIWIGVTDPDPAAFAVIATAFSLPALALGVMATACGLPYRRLRRAGWL